VLSHHEPRLFATLTAPAGRGPTLPGGGYPWVFPRGVESDGQRGSTTAGPWTTRTITLIGDRTEADRICADWEDVHWVMLSITPGSPIRADTHAHRPRGSATARLGTATRAADGPDD